MTFLPIDGCLWGASLVAKGGVVEKIQKQVQSCFLLPRDVVACFVPPIIAFSDLLKKFCARMESVFPSCCSWGFCF